jgi:hypothetical protein
MTQNEGSAIKEALDGAANAIKRGDLATGNAGLRWVLKREPNNVLAWLWMSRCVESAEQKAECFNRVLAVDGTNKYALEGIQRFGGSGGDQASPASAADSSAAHPVQDLTSQRARIALKDKLRTILKRPAARLALFAVSSLFLIVALGFACSGIGGGSGGPDLDDSAWDMYYGCLVIQRDWGASNSESREICAQYRP